MSRFEQIMERDARRNELVRLIVEVRDQDPEYLDDLLGALVEMRGGQKPKSNGPLPLETTKRRGAGITVFDVVDSWFRSENNAWATVKQIAASTGINANSVGHLIYKGRKGSFEERENPEGRAKQYRLIPRPRLVAGAADEGRKAHA